MVRKKPLTKQPKTEQEDFEEGEEPLGTSPPQSGLVPFGNSPFYHTPDEPADPRDCNRYPSSFYCGETPWSVLPFGIEPAIVEDECNFGIELTPVIGFVTLPPVQLVHRRPGESCRDKPPQEIPSPQIDEYFIPIPSNPGGECLYRIKVNFVDIGVLKPSGEIGLRTLDFARNRDSYVGIDNYIYAYCWGPLYGLKIVTQFTSPDGFSYSSEDGSATTIGQSIFIRSRGFVGTETPNHSLEESIYRYDIGYGTTLEDRYAAIKNKSNSDYGFINGTNGWIVEGAGDIIQVPSYGDIQQIWCSSSPTIYFLPPPPPFPPKRCDCAMTCCPDVTQNEDLLKSLIKKIDALSKVIGVDDYPVNLPTTLISRDEGFLGNLVPNFNEDVPSLTRFLGWYVKRFDEIMGQWEIPIEIKDSDPSKPGDQPLGIKLPNMAEAIAEMFTLCFQTNINTETLLNAAIRTLTETAADKQQNFITYKLLQSLTDWVGFKQKDLALKMPLLMTLEKTRYDEILKESEVEVGCVEFDEKFGLEADLIKLREAVAILQAQYKVKLNPSADLKPQILAHLLDAFRDINKVNSNSEDDDADFAEFINDVETGFINSPGANQTTNPYDKPFSNRPKIRDLSKYEPPTTP